MFERHINRKLYFDEQDYTTRNYVIPFIEKYKKITPNLEVLEIGCGEAGNLKPFVDIGCKCTGVDLSEAKIKSGNEFFSDHPNKNNLQLVIENIYESGDRLTKRFDVIILRDTIEHIHDQQKFMHYVKRFLKDDGKFFISYPPWQMPFGGHQQICTNKFLCKLPYFHLLPVFLYKGMLKLFGESEDTVANLLEVKETGISIERLRRIIKGENYKIDEEFFYFINPNYEIKFKLKPRKQNAIIGSIPWVRNFFTTNCYYLLSN
jgi:SAM-dependent methyltransferase